MKRLFLLSFLFFLVLTSCKDNDGDPAPNETKKDLVTGSWMTVNQEFKYYDENDQLVHEERNDTNTVFRFDGSSYDSEGQVSGTYTVTKSNGKDYLNLTTGNQTEQIELTSITDTSMSWKKEKDNAQYFDDGLKTADYAVIIIDFTKW